MATKSDNQSNEYRDEHVFLSSILFQIKINHRVVNLLLQFGLSSSVGDVGASTASSSPPHHSQLSCSP